jgi:glycerol-3-phosphate cytidylyltransferase
MKLYKKGIIAGSFDLIHPGYIRMFSESKNVCDHLIIALQDDPTIDRPEKNKPVQTWEERKEILESIKQIDEILYYSTEKELYEVLKNTKYDVRILGSDYIGKTFTGHDLNKPIYFCERGHGYSLTELKKKIYNSLSLKK